MVSMSQLMNQNPLIKEDVALLTLSVEALERYLLSAELYWPLFPHKNMKQLNPHSRLTPGNLLLSMQRLSAIPFGKEEQTEIDATVAAFNRVRSAWKSHWIRKAQQEHQARMDLWHCFLRDLFEDRKQYAANYAYAVRWRVILHLLGAEEYSVPESTLITLSAMDDSLKAISLEGPFLWGENIKPGFSELVYWYLYRKISV